MGFLEVYSSLALSPVRSHRESVQCIAADAIAHNSPIPRRVPNIK